MMKENVDDNSLAKGKSKKLNAKISHDHDIHHLYHKTSLFSKIALVMSTVLLCVMLSALYISYYNNTQRVVKDIKVMMNTFSPLLIDTAIYQDTETAIELNRSSEGHKEILSLTLYDLDGDLLHFYENGDGENYQPLKQTPGLSIYKGNYKLTYPVSFNGDDIFHYVIYYSSSEIVTTILIQLFVFILPFLFFIFFILIYMYRKVTRPLTFLIGQLPKIGSGGVNISDVGDAEGEVSLLASELKKADECIHNTESKLQGLNRKLREQADDLSEAIKIKAEFMANMSHEIRTPMNGVLGFVQCLEERKLDKESRRQIGYIKESAYSLLVIINEILDYSKLESGNVELHLTPFAFNPFVHSCITPFIHQAKIKKIHVSTEIGDDIASSFIADEGRLRQILINLVGNAVKFTHTGSVTLSVERLSSPVQQCEELRKYNDKHIQWLRFKVIDTGIGIAEEKLAFIFDSYRQADGSISRQFGGTGLGLSISNSLCKLMFAKLKVESCIGKGTTFWFDIPLKQSDEKRGENSEENIQNTNLSMYEDRKILVVEDSMVNQQLIKAFLTAFGLKNIVVVNDGVQAVEYMIENTADIILMDCQMPNMGGLEATELIRETQSIHRPVIIALTANVLEEEKQRCLKAGMDDYVSKPIDKVMLYKSLQRAFNHENGDDLAANI
ncbi:response regulator [Photobacterium leiognathi]|uniref:response regulator n=1 Tax=Photobacterium leiognathi TaxID=553611 RepID=UPI002738998A|nr:response regulator [Photobacterium leiognathi]